MPRFVVHEHHATRLHWDLRLEMDNVLKSWAVPKGPPIQQGVKRLAVQVDDHDLGYIDFQGTIPEGHYGAGEVTIWDDGAYTLEIRESDRIQVTFLGKRLTGRYNMIKTQKGWLFFKAKS